MTTFILTAVILFLCIIIFFKNSYIRNLEESVDTLYASASNSAKKHVDCILWEDREQ